MRPVILSIQAFGPFAGCETVDFRLLGNNPLFLINGPTGAGKSTILDAISFALYGQTTGAERDATQMRCDHAELSMLTEVTLEFELQGKRYRIRRVPAQVRAKTKGEGTTAQAPEAQLWELDGSEEGKLLVSKSVNDANDTVKTLIGLDVQQFRQVMVLPQGKFRELLLADSKDRERIFSQLFQTSIYKRIEDSLKARASGISRDVDAHRNKIRGILESAEVSAEKEIDGLLTELQPEIAILKEKKEHASQQQVLLEREQATALALQERFAELAKKQQDLEKILALKPEITAKQSLLDRAVKAQKIQALHLAQQLKMDELGELQQKLEKIETQLQAANEKYTSGEKLLGDAFQAFSGVDGLKRQQLDLGRYQAQLSELEAASKKLQSCDKEWLISKQQLQSRQVQQQELILEQQDTELRIAALTVELEPLADEQFALQTLKQQVSQRSQLEKQKNEANILSTVVKGCQQAQTEQQILFDTAKKHTQRTELNWHKGQAALLASRLSDGEACPVCGSKEHPQLALNGVSHAPVTSEQLESVRTAEQQVSDALQSSKNALLKADNELIQIRKEQQKLESEIGALAAMSMESATQVLNQKVNAVTELLNNKDKRKKLSERLEIIRQQLLPLSNEIKNLETTASLSVQKRIQAESSVSQLRIQIPEEYQNARQLNDELAKIAQKIDSLTTAKNLAEESASKNKSNLDIARTRRSSIFDQWQKTQIRSTEASAAWSQALQHSEFDSLQVFLDASLPEAVQQKLQQQLVGHKSALDSLRGVVDQLESELRGKKPPDLDKIKNALDEKRALLQSADEHWQQVHSRFKQLAANKKKLVEAHLLSEELERQYAIYGTLSEVASGATDDRISLQRFVLSVLLDDVLIQASHRLKLMSRGRYRLLRKEDKAKGNKASGLELEVEDGNTGKPRAVATLSGGESFMAALSLALGLSDVVQAYAGGIKLDTLFIDEGFGSLDSESLDAAINVLIDLQASGRMIGIISHVSELKEQMALRLDVHSGVTGSRIATVGA